MESFNLMNSLLYLVDRYLLELSFPILLFMLFGVRLFGRFFSKLQQILSETSTFCIETCKNSKMGISAIPTSAHGDSLLSKVMHTIYNSFWDTLGKSAIWGAQQLAWLPRRAAFHIEVMEIQMKSWSFLILNGINYLQNHLFCEKLGF